MSWLKYFLIPGIQTEPAIQSKRRTEGPRTTLTNGFYDNGIDYNEFALLGNQDKFSENVKYKLRESQRPREVSPPKQMRLQKVCMTKNEPAHEIVVLIT